MSVEFLQQLLRRLHQEPRVLAVYVSDDLMAPAAGDREAIELHLAVEPAFREALGGWLAVQGEAAYSGAEPHGWTAVTTDGVEWCFHLYGPDEPLPTHGLHPVFDRRPNPAARTGDPGMPGFDLGEVAGRFWRDLYRAARAIEQERPLTAHHWLQACGGHLINLYRIALAPGATGQGWEGADSLPGLLGALGPVREALSAPLETRAQRSAAYRLAAAFEGLILPLCQRLGIDYPMALRNLAFRRLDAGRTGDPGEGSTEP